MDGDGIETRSGRDGQPVLFDHDADGRKTGTGWLQPDDGWLTLDRNANGTIDSGRELFGVDTLKRDGTLARNGFDALTDLDQNGDGKINAADSANINATGNASPNLLTGNAGNNRMDGGSGADTMIGGGGNDVYVVDNTGDVLTEAAGAGIDGVESSITWSLAGTELENLTLTASTAINGTGNAYDNLLIGGSGANTLSGGDGNDTLDGGTGTDTLVGGKGDDSYIVDATADVITEAAGEGIDSVSSSATYSLSLSTSVENLTLTGSNAINATGNALGNVLIGNSGANRIDGGGGADTMTGGAGNDTYVVDVIGDLINEVSGGGTDTVESNISWTLGAELENLTLTSTGAIDATGNALANTLRGNSGANRLDGGTGNDTMVGGTGNDTYVVDSVSDVVTEAASGGTDTIETNITLPTLAAEVENVTLTGTANINATGNGVANTLRGNSGGAQFVAKFEHPAGQEIGQWRLDLLEPPQVGDVLRPLHREHETGRGFVMPLGVVLGALERIEGAVDLDGRHHPRSEFELTALGHALGVEDAPPGLVAPAGDADPDVAP
ncbi:hypothetical protein ASC95_27250 [Pelomonas sp. Root1217]|nr:hypothetical protein ASC95_27250 [Pelomonas sp. Root1217]